MSLAAKLPYDHPYAGGYPGIGSQPLPTDADAIDYLTRMATADGAGVETGVAVAVDAFFKDAKDSGVFSALKACCILAGARTLAGALVPVVGTAPTNLPVANGFVEGDYTRGGATPGLKGDGTSYIDSGRANNADAFSDKHLAVYATNASTGVNEMWIGITDGSYATRVYKQSNEVYYAYDGRTFAYTPGHTQAGLTGLVGLKRESSSSFSAYLDGTEVSKNEGEFSFGPYNHFVFTHNNAGASPTSTSTSTFAFYSIGTSLSLADLDTAVTNLITAIGNAL
jgi:hypothetical protein